MRQTEGFVTVENGLQLYYRMVGDGTDAVIVPAASWLAADLEPLAEAHTLIFYDQPSRGQSDAVTDASRVGMQYEVSDLEAVRQYFGIESISLVGWSYLGGVTALYAMDHPERVSRLLLIGPMPPRKYQYDDPRVFDPADRVDPAGMQSLQEMREAGLDASDPVAYSREFWLVNLPRQMGNPKALTRMRSAPWNSPNEDPDTVFKHFDRLFGSLEAWDWRSRAATLDVPTLVVHGMDDLIPAASSREWVTTFPDARLLTVAGAGHYPWIENPEAFFPAAGQFLAGEWPKGAERIYLVDE